jgi:CDP-diacylglycerol--glycerol-3-phosphate 3-phosphatidyltransferase
MSDGPILRPGSARFWTLPNVLSLTRVALSVPFVLVMLLGGEAGRWWGFGIVCAGILTDKLDGWLARRWNEVSEWGKILDPLGDKIGIAAIGIVLYLQGVLPVWFLALLIGRDILIFAGGVYLRTATGVVLPSNTTGKWAVGVIAATLALLLIGVGGPLIEVGMTASVVMLLLSLAFYAVRFVQIVRLGKAVHGNS